MEQLFSVRDKVAVVTGGSRGIGAMIAKGFVVNGARTYISARKPEELKATEEALSQLGTCVAIEADLSTMDGVRRFVEAVSEHEDQIDVLVNNAGANWGASIEEFPESGWDKVMHLNVKAPFFLIQQFLDLLKASASLNDPARVINISSINALSNPKQPNYSYSASKAAILHMTRHLAADLASYHINVNGIAPGLFPSKMTAFMLEGNEEVISEVMPLGRVGNEEDAAGAAIYLSSRASAWVTGHTIVVDGGVLASAG